MAKRGVQEPEPVGDDSSSADDLQSLLAQLNGGNPLDLTTMAAINAAKSYAADDNDDAQAKKNPHNETLKSTIVKLFVDHVGKSPEIVIGNAIRLATEEMDREGYIFNLKQRRCINGGERESWLNHPVNSRIEGPNPDGKIWLHLFLGDERAKELLQGCVPLYSDEMEASIKENKVKDDTEGLILRALKDEVSKLSTIQLLRNILRYTRREASNMPLIDLLRFSVLYGLDGVMKDILLGRYGDMGGLSVNSLIPLGDKPLDGSEDSSYLHMLGGRRKFFYPLYAVGALLGHTNIASVALTELEGGGFDVPFGVQMKHDVEIEVHDEHYLPSEVFLWVFNKNLQHMIKCLVECGFQFRWIDHDELGRIFDKIFEAHDWPRPPWSGELDEEDVMWESSRERRRLRGESAYKAQMEMLDVLISLGFPLELFLPTEPTIEREEKMQKEGKLQTRQEQRAHEKALTREEKMANQRVYKACCDYNSLQTSEPETLTMGDFYRKLKSRWDKGEASAQVAKLDEFEALDSRWRRTQRQQNAEEDNESDNESEDYESESGEGSSYDGYPGSE